MIVGREVEERTLRRGALTLSCRKMGFFGAGASIKWGVPGGT